ncbi:CBS domain-containing protein [Natronospira bacteriovora]|uniref:CBS domain-containing protein n=1 Tax=Natronospira bacteriovora TaxID=3069753 RepID=A0ABU0W7T2_9GAMM|nr:CBS domain-containing protein [Natronospira sp. AB-CW4]MDQ2069075.1 CBS domain-containing protein [Natronospira sp. AB-CW4]
MKVNDIMVTDVARCSPQTSLHDIARMMWERDCGAIPLVNEQDQPVGIVTDRDIAIGAALQHRPLWEIRGEEVAHGRAVHCCHPEDDIADALALLERHEVRRLPVIDPSNRLCGIVSMGDIISFTRAGRARKGDREMISAEASLDFLRHVSAHHQAGGQTAV